MTGQIAPLFPPQPEGEPLAGGTDQMMPQPPSGPRADESQYSPQSISIAGMTGATPEAVDEVMDTRNVTPQTMADAGTITKRITTNDPVTVKTITKKLQGTEGALTDAEKIAAIAVGLGSLLVGTAVGAATGVGASTGFLGGLKGAGLAGQEFQKLEDSRDRDGGTEQTFIRENRTKTSTETIEGAPAKPKEGNKNLHIDPKARGMLPQADGSLKAGNVTRITDKTTGETWYRDHRTNELIPAPPPDKKSKIGEKEIERGDLALQNSKDQLSQMAVIGEMGMHLANAKDTGKVTNFVRHARQFIQDVGPGDLVPSGKSYIKLAQLYTQATGQTLKLIAGSRFSDKDLEFFRQILPAEGEQQGVSAVKMMGLADSFFRQARDSLTNNLSAVDALATERPDARKFRDRMLKLDKYNVPATIDGSVELADNPWNNWIREEYDPKPGDILFISRKYLLGLSDKPYTKISFGAKKNGK